MENTGKYSEFLKEKLEQLVKERDEIEKKGTKATIIERNRYFNLNDEIAKLSADLEVLENANNPASIASTLDLLVSDTASAEDKEKTKDEIIAKFTEILEDTDVTSTLTEAEMKDLDKTLQVYTDKLKHCNETLEFAELMSENSQAIAGTKELIKKLEDKIAAINAIKNNPINIDEITKQLDSLMNDETLSDEDKLFIITQLNSLYSSYAPSKEEEIKAIMVKYEKELAKKEKKEAEKQTPEDKKESTKETLREKTAKLYESNKKVIKIAGASILVVAMLVVGSKLIKNIKEANINDVDERPSYSTVVDDKTTGTAGTIEDTKEETSANIKALTDLGYNEYLAGLMATNFDEGTIAKILEMPYYEAIANYAIVEAFNVDYVLDYENARTIHNITAEKAVDYVNRSYKIAETKFYDEASIDDIVAVLKAVDDKQTFMLENNAENQSITAGLTSIYNNYSFTNEAHEEDITKLDALKYFAEEGTELDLFLTDYAELCKDVLKAKGDTKLSEETKQNMYNYLDVFANTYAGNKNDVANINETAVLENTYDWAVAYNSFIKPFISTFITEKNVEDYACLQINMLSNYEQWAQVNGCYLETEEEMTLGGN